MIALLPGERERENAMQSQTVLFLGIQMYNLSSITHMIKDNVNRDYLCNRSFQYIESRKP